MKTRLMLATAMIMSVNLFAQNQNEEVDTRHRNRSEDLKTMLSLDDQQYASVRQLNAKYATRRAEIRRESMDNMKALRTEREKEFVAVLTPEQKAKWDAHKKDSEVKRKEQQKLAMEKRQSVLKRKLLMSTEQAAKFNSENKAFGDKLRQLRDAKKTPATHGAEFAKLRAEHKAAVQQILNEEQFRKWQSLHGKRHHHRRR